MPGAALMKSNMLDPSRRDRSEVLGAEASPESGVSRFDARARSLDHDRFRDARQLQDRRSLDGGAGPDADVLFVIGRESLHLDVEHVQSRRQSREAQLPFLVRGQRRRAANQRRRADTDDRTRKDAALCVLDGSDEGSRQPLRTGHVGLKHIRDGEKEQNVSTHSETPPLHFSFPGARR